MSTQSQTLPHPGSTPSNMNTSTGGTESAASTNFSADDAPVNEYGERRFVKKLSWFGPLNLATILACTIPTAATASMFSLMYTIALPEGPANAAIGQTNIAGAFIGAVFAVLIGHLSDITRTRMGRRNPWILGGAALATIGLIGMDGQLLRRMVRHPVLLHVPGGFEHGVRRIYRPAPRPRAFTPAR